ncbi:MAG: small basic protein [Planctomycetes bacterium]|nr:small basic protein [Planctomycetota bacterium]
MSMDRTLHIASGVTSRRNVLKRSERISLMKDNGDFDEATDSPLGLAKTRVRVTKVRGKAKKEEAAPASAVAEKAPAAEAAPAGKKSPSARKG